MVKGTTYRLNVCEVDEWSGRINYSYFSCTLIVMYTLCVVYRMRNENSILSESLNESLIVESNADEVPSAQMPSISSQVSSVSSTSSECDYLDLFPVLEEDDMHGTVFSQNILDVNQTS